VSAPAPVLMWSKILTTTFAKRPSPTLSSLATLPLTRSMGLLLPLPSALLVLQENTVTPGPLLMRMVTAFPVIFALLDLLLEPPT
jgi:hypothetical protein